MNCSATEAAFKAHQESAHSRPISRARRCRCWPSANACNTRCYKDAETRRTRYAGPLWPPLSRTCNRTGRHNLVRSHSCHLKTFSACCPWFLSSSWLRSLRPFYFCRQHQTSCLHVAGVGNRYGHRLFCAAVRQGRSGQLGDRVECGLLPGHWRHALFRGEKHVTRGDWIAFLITFFAIPLWVVTSDPLWSVLLVTVIGAVAYYPTFRKSFAKPGEELAFKSVLTVIRYLFTCWPLSILRSSRASTRSSVFSWSSASSSCCLASCCPEEKGGRTRAIVIYPTHLGPA